MTTWYLRIRLIKIGLLSLLRNLYYVRKHLGNTWVRYGILRHPIHMYFQLNLQPV